jgi:hypothetical protein
MMKKIVVGVVALAIFLGVGFVMADKNQKAGLRVAETGRNLCFAQKGYVDGDMGIAPDNVVQECGRYYRDYEAGETMRYVKAGLIGLGAALVFLVLAWFFLLRGRKAEGTPPPAA